MKTGPVRMLPPEVRAIREQYARGDGSLAAIARAHGVTKAAVVKIVHRRSYKEVE